MTRAARRTAAAILLAASLAAAPSAWAAPRDRDGRRTPVVQAVERAAPAVVNISALQIREVANPFSPYRNPRADEFFREFFGRTPSYRPERSLGSGVIIRPDGFILTNEHVVSRASEIRVSLAGREALPARLIGADPENDLAVIKIDVREPLPHLPLGRSDDLMIGETVIAIGNPFGLAHTVTTGVVSALGRTLDDGRDKTRRHPADFIQTDASINPGNSGGPLLNIYGELIGINTAIFSNAQGIGFAIPIDRAHRIVSDLITFGKVRRSWVGMVVRDLMPRMAGQMGFPQPHGAIATQVLADSPAQRAGIRAGDILLAFGGKDVGSREDYLNELAGYTVGSRVPLRLWRQGKAIETQVTLAPIPAALAEEIAWNWLGLRAAPIGPDAIQRFRLGTRQGMVITEVLPGGPSEGIGIRPGDVIRRINAQETADPETFREALVRARELPRVQLLIQRRQQGYNVTLEP
ncbi:MAG: trypsin-like peptidase domain-containing protein [Candidatus Tectomicrobia bacterium]|uniref:Trypsin-like peptidase domain-containing protein n=1 Tax=Tectimicrobiota bacterium TaxID=2528274 RepID=A0A932MMH2_UNCTE|nr:trypsin-like peptidase domain-containing protein [Candidatus Tectomicrobia bacterium]